METVQTTHFFQSSSNTCTESFKVLAPGYYKLWLDINGILTKDYSLKPAFAGGPISQPNMLRTTDV